jgi:hypothetical protein
MVRGMEHCAGGEGPDTFDKMTAIEQWVEQEKVPDRRERGPTGAGLVALTRKSHVPAIFVAKCKTALLFHCNRTAAIA